MSVGLPAEVAPRPTLNTGEGSRSDEGGGWLS
jgi:hypothetical protein